VLEVATATSSAGPPETVSATLVRVKVWPTKMILGDATPPALSFATTAIVSGVREGSSSLSRVRSAFTWASVPLIVRLVEPTPVIVPPPPAACVSAASSPCASEAVTVRSHALGARIVLQACEADVQKLEVINRLARALV
jgi:hypothetical protein